MGSRTIARIWIEADSESMIECTNSGTTCFYRSRKIGSIHTDRLYVSLMDGI